MDAALITLALLFPASTVPGGGGRPPDLRLPVLVADEELLRDRYRLEGAARDDRLGRFYAETLDRIGRTDFAALDTAARIDLLLVEGHVRRRLADLEQGRALREQAAALLGFHDVAGRIEDLVRRSAPWPLEELARDLEAGAKAAEAVAKEQPLPLDAAAAGEEPAPARRALSEARGVRLAATIATADRRHVEGWLKSQSEQDPLFRFWLHAPGEAWLRAVESLAKRLDDEILPELKKRPGQNALAIGAERFALELHLERVPMTPEELLAFGETRLAEVEAEMAETAKAMRPDLDWRAALQEVKQDHVPVGGQREYAAALVNEVNAFVETQGLFRLPPLAKECWSLIPIGTDRQKTYPFAFYEKPAMGVAYATESMDHERKLMAMRGNNRAFMRNVAPHELIPGHHLQRFYAERHHPERRDFPSSFYVEGWGFYTELLLAETGWFRTPPERLGHLFWKMLRAARILVSTRYHLGTMSHAEMVEFMTGRAGLERANAEAEVERYMTFSPLYQAAYMVGGWQIRELREEARARQGAAFDLAAFHDAVLCEGAIPMRLLRYPVLGDPVPREP